MQNGQLYQCPVCHCQNHLQRAVIFCLARHYQAGGITEAEYWHYLEEVVCGTRSAA